MNCLNCGNRFVPKIRQKYCDDKKCKSDRRKLGKERRKDNYKLCKIDDCSNRANRIKYGLCESCYYRLRRNGTTDKLAWYYTHKTAAGYVYIWDGEHPLAQKNGYVSKHRKVAYDQHGPAPHNCYWCNVELMSWNNIVIDHKNENKEDNDPSNLVISCCKCNRARGALLPFLRKMNPDKFKEFIDLCSKQLNKGR